MKSAKTICVSVVQCRGTPYEVGRAQARLFAMTPKGRAFLRNKATKFPWWFDIRTEQRMFARFAPVLWEELVGLADELGITMEWAAFRFGNDGMRPPIGACSAAAYHTRCQGIGSLVVAKDTVGTVTPAGAGAWFTVVSYRPVSETIHASGLMHCKKIGDATSAC
jgi:hypothetical protein